MTAPALCGRLPVHDACPVPQLTVLILCGEGAQLRAVYFPGGQPVLGLEIAGSRNSDLTVLTDPFVLLHKLCFSISRFRLCWSGGDG